MTELDRWARPNLPATPHPDGLPGHVLLVPGDPRYCWNPFRHDPHEFHYTLDDDLTGSYDCDGHPAPIDILVP